ncbi:hypothetical protein ACYFX5_20535 [Bremerella sp. T1]|uniref:hypothetical protein n=1 Tax=Bremerella sp. TYQ1 TaxID=3119568 RepID=UPI001CC92B43|nr:hypothetical protein [Bremerella volcania]UBM35430.1 hypothetical protein LA756_22475 [Bremerella volcania]
MMSADIIQAKKTSTTGTKGYGTIQTAPKNLGYGVLGREAKDAPRIIISQKPFEILPDSAENRSETVQKSR